MKNQIHWSDLPDQSIIFINSFTAGKVQFDEPITVKDVKEFIPVTLWHKTDVEDLKELFEIELLVF